MTHRQTYRIPSLPDTPFYGLTIGSFLPSDEMDIPLDWLLFVFYCLLLIGILQMMGPYQHPYEIPIPEDKYYISLTPSSHPQRSRKLSMGNREFLDHIHSDDDDDNDGAKDKTD